MTNVISLVLELAVQQGFGPEPGQRNEPFPENSPGTLRPVVHQLFCTGIDRAGNEIEDQFSLILRNALFLQTLEQDSGVLHIFPQEFLMPFHLLPDAQKKGQGVSCAENFPRESDTGGAHIRNPFAEFFLNDGFVSKHQHFAELVQSVTPGTTADLVDFGSGHRPEFSAVIFLGFGEDHPLDGQGDPKPDGVGCDHNICFP